MDHAFHKVAAAVPRPVLPLQPILSRYSFVVILLLPHTWIGVLLICLSVQQVLWLLAGRDYVAQVVDVWQQQNAKGSWVYSMRYQWVEHGSPHLGTRTVEYDEYQQ